MPLFLILIFIFLFGLIIGSFLNCLIYRLRENESLMGRSYCPKCHKQIAWYDNLPVLSFIILGGKCRQCKKPISWQYPIIELTAGLLFMAAFMINFQFSLPQAGQAIFNFQSIFNFQFSNINYKLLVALVRDWLIISAMIVVFVYDLRWYEILDIITLPAGVAVFVLNLILGFGLWNMLISGIIGGSFFLIQFLISRGKWMGGGDIRLGLLMGVALGWPGVLVAIIISYFIGSIAGIGLILTGKKQWGSQVPLGVFLAMGTIITLFWQARILDWYFGG